MALINCPECNKRLSDCDENCQYCGCNIKEYYEKLNDKEFNQYESKPELLSCFCDITGLIALFLLLFGLFGLYQVITGNAEDGASVYVIFIFIILLCITWNKVSKYFKQMSQYQKMANRYDAYKRKKKIYTLVGVICIIAVISIIVGNIIHQESLIKQTIIDRGTSISEELGLQNVKVVITGKDSKHDWYNIIIESSNLGSFSPIELIEIDRQMLIDDAYITSYISNGDRYRMYPSSLSVYKNGEEIYNDYFNSDTHKSALENKTTSSQSSGITVTDDDERNICWSLAIDVVEAQLKSPSSAKFPFSYANKDVLITKSGDTYTVKAWVDAENSFGAKLRSDFTVTITKSGTKFTAESCVIDE